MTSFGGTQGEDAAFPNQGASGIPPSPTRENPAAVYPKTTPEPNSRHSLSGGASISTAQAPDHTRSDSADRVDNILKQFENATDHLLQFLNKESPRSGEALRTFEYAKGEVIRYMKERANEEGLGGQLQSAGNNLTTQEGGMFVE